MSRKVIPVSVQLAKGNPNRLTKAEIKARQEAEESFKPGIDKIELPTWLDKEGKKEWKRIAKDLEELNILTNVDITALGMYCDAYSKYQLATKKINEEGMFIEYTNKAGATNIIEHPAVKAQVKYADLIKKLCSEFGLTPSARAKITLPKLEENKEETLEDKLFGGL